MKEKKLVTCDICDKEVKLQGLAAHKRLVHRKDSAVVSLSEEVKAQLTEKDTEIARLKEELTQALSPPDRFDTLVEDIKSLTLEGKAKLAEAVGIKFSEDGPRPLPAPARDASPVGYVIPKPLPKVVYVGKAS